MVQKFSKSNGNGWDVKPPVCGPGATILDSNVMYKPENLFPAGTQFNCSRNCSSECYFDEPCPEQADKEGATDGEV